MRLIGSDSDDWHRKIHAATAYLQPTNADFPWNELQEQTQRYLKKKKKKKISSQEQVDERLVALLHKHPSTTTVAACAHALSPNAVRNFIAVDCKANFDLSSFLEAIIAVNHENPAAVNQTEAHWAQELVAHSDMTGYSEQRVSHQLEKAVYLLRNGLAPDLLLYDQIVKSVRTLCQAFAARLETFRLDSLWMKAHSYVGWLAPLSARFAEVPSELYGPVQLLDVDLPNWHAWAVWRPDMYRLRRWEGAGLDRHHRLHALLSLEGPDVVSGTQATMRETLISQVSSSSQSTLNWQTVRIEIPANQYLHHTNPFRSSSSESAARKVMDRLLNVLDATAWAGHDYIIMVEHLCVDKVISENILQIMEGIQSLNKSLITTVMQAYTLPCLSIDQGLDGVNELLIALSEPSRTRLRGALSPYLVDRISNYIRTYQYELRQQCDAGRPWNGAELKLIAFTQPLEKIHWLLPLLDASVHDSIMIGPGSMEKIRILGTVRTHVQSVLSGATVILVDQIDAYCKALLLPDCTVDPLVQDLVQCLASLWQHDRDCDQRELAIRIAQLTKTSYHFRAQCIGKISALKDGSVHKVLMMLRGTTNMEPACIDFVRLLAASKMAADAQSCWGLVLRQAIEEHDSRLIHYALSSMDVKSWLAWLRDINTIFRTDIDEDAPKLLSIGLNRWSQTMIQHLPTLLRLEKTLNHGPALQLFLAGSDHSSNDRLIEILVSLGRTSKDVRYEFTMAMLTMLHGDNVDQMADILSLVSSTTLDCTKMCFSVLEASRRTSTRLAEAIVASQLRTCGLAKSARTVVIDVARFLGISLDSNGNVSADCIKENIKHMKEQYAKILAEAHRLDESRLALKFANSDGVSTLLQKLNIEATRVVEELLSGLPPALDGLVESVGDNELEMQFPLTDLKPLQRIAIGAGETQSLLVRLTIRVDGKPIKFCIHLSKEQGRSTSSHTPWVVFKGNRAPHEKYCYGRSNRGVFQLSRILWHDLRSNFISLEKTYTLVAAKLQTLGERCMACGTGRARLRRSTICTAATCREVFSRAHIRIQLADIWHDPPVVDLLLTAIHAVASSGKLDLLVDCPVKDAPTVLETLDRLPKVVALKEHLTSCLNIHGKSFCLSNSLAGFFNGPFLAEGLIWACNSYRGFLVSASGQLKIPSFGNNQFLLANAAPNLETAFARHMPTTQETSQILFHGTSLDRLHAILCQGLQVQSGTSLQIHGAAYGHGIYMADEPSTAWGYTTNTVGGWNGSAFQNLRVLLGCELAGAKPNSAYGGIYVITDATRLMVRYIFLLGSSAVMPQARHVRPPMQSVFANLRSGAI